MSDNGSDGLSTAYLESAQYYIFVTQIYFCCMYAVVVWDWLVSLTREWRLIWKSDWTAVKISYLFCRYWPICVMPYILYAYVADHPMHVCHLIFKAPVALAMWNQAGAEVVLLIRTYAFFNRNKYILVGLSVCLAGVLAFQLYVAIAQMAMLPFVVAPFDKGPCLPASKPHSDFLLGFFLAPLAFDSVVTFMTLWRAIKIRRLSGGSSSQLVQTFIREGVFYYIMISVANLINGIFYLQPQQVMSAINIPLSIMFPDILACRLILDLRDQGNELSQPTVIVPSRGGRAPSETSSTTYGRGSPKLDSRLSTVLPMAYQAGKTFKDLMGWSSKSSNLSTGTDTRVYESQDVTDYAVEATMEEGQIPTSPHPYHVIDIPTTAANPFDGIRIDVEKTQM